MSDLLEPLNKLIEKWNGTDPNGAFIAVSDPMDGYRNCADDITLLLPEIERAVADKVNLARLAESEAWHRYYYGAPGIENHKCIPGDRMCERLAANRAAASPVSQQEPTRRVPCGIAENVITSTSEVIPPTVNPVSPTEEIPLLPDQEWSHLTPESQAKVRKWFNLAAERLQLILDEPVSQQAGAPDEERRR